MDGGSALAVNADDGATPRCRGQSLPVEFLDSAAHGGRQPDAFDGADLGKTLAADRHRAALGLSSLVRRICSFHA